MKWFNGEKSIFFGQLSLVCLILGSFLFLGGVYGNLNEDLAIQGTFNSNSDVEVLFEESIEPPFASLGHADLKYSTFLGGDDYDTGSLIYKDAEGYIYLAGFTQSDNFPTTANAFCRTHTGSDDLYVSKISPDGQTLVYSTLIGGRGSEMPYDMEVDAEGCVYLVGFTYDYLFDFPTTTGAINETSNGEYDVFILKLNADGTDLEYSTVLGGDKSDFGRGIELDSEGCAYITGYTEMHSSISFPTIAGAYDTIHNDYDAFLCKVSANGQELLNSTFIGGNGMDFAWALERDDEGNLYLAGGASAGFPTTEGAYQTSNNGNYDAFVCKMSSDGSDLLFSTYIGGDASDRCFSMTMDAEGCFYLTGITMDGTYDFPTTEGAFDRDYNGGSGDIYVCKVSADGTELLYSTLIGGSGQDIPNRIAVDEDGCAYVVGDIYGATTGFPTTTGAINETAPGGGYDSIICKVDIFGEDLLYSTFIGCDGEDGCNGIFIDADNYIYITGGTQDSTIDYPTTDDAMNTTHNGLINCYDVYYSKIDIGPLKPLFITNNQTIWKTSINIQWNGVADADQYNIYVDNVLRTTVDGSATSTDLSLNEDGTYLITVSAVRNGYESYQSAAITIRVDMQPLFIFIITLASIVVAVVVVSMVRLKKKARSKSQGTDVSNSEVKEKKEGNS